MKLLYKSLRLYLVAISVSYAQDSKNESMINGRKPLSTLSPYSSNFNYSDNFDNLQRKSTDLISDFFTIQFRPREDCLNKRHMNPWGKQHCMEDIAKEEIMSHFVKAKLTILETAEWEIVRSTLNLKLTQSTLDKFYYEAKQKKQEDLIASTLRLIKAANRLTYPSYQWTKPLKAEDLIPFFLNIILNTFPQFFSTEISSYSVESIDKLKKLLADLGESYNFSKTASTFVVDCIWKAHSRYLLDNQ
ncbi:MAG: hypothetical protein K0M45_12230 [Candidatus Paracaedibacteraceae bacterium]|nr:hypothetical protein [Candidatus Paracaedibacteraceae bacterium]